MPRLLFGAGRCVETGVPPAFIPREVHQRDLAPRRPRVGVVEGERQNRMGPGRMVVVLVAAGGADFRTF